jgi:hypothetical protein
VRYGASRLCFGASRLCFGASRARWALRAAALGASRPRLGASRPESLTLMVISAKRRVSHPGQARSRTDAKRSEPFQGRRGLARPPPRRSSRLRAPPGVGVNPLCVRERSPPSDAVPMLSTLPTGPMGDGLRSPDREIHRPVLAARPDRSRACPFNEPHARVSPFWELNYQK